jgi:cellulose synthase/poly-beta-1,6-N-acetylglucosamine synthase-like glycosyltransferase
MILPLEEKNIWQKTITLLNLNFFMIIRRGQELIDSILVQSGGYSVFRKDAIIKTGGFADKLFGEDGEITHRMGRYGYRLEFEPNSVLYGAIPEKLTDVMNQRTRWCIAFYQARGINLELVRHLRGYDKPRAFVFLFALISHGIGLGQSMTLPFLIASAITGIYFNASHFNLFWLERILLLQSVFFGLSLTTYIYYLRKFRKLGNLKYYPIARFYGIIVRMVTKPVAMEVLLNWSSRWNSYTHESFEDLRSEVKRVDPGNY